MVSQEPLEDDSFYKKYPFETPQYNSSRYDTNSYYDIPQHRVSRHNVTDEDHAYYQTDWLNNKPDDSRDKDVNDTHFPRNRRASTGSNTSSVQFLRACKRCVKGKVRIQTH